MLDLVELDDCQADQVLGLILPKFVDGSFALLFIPLIGIAFRVDPSSYRATGQLRMFVGGSAYNNPIELQRAVDPRRGSSPDRLWQALEALANDHKLMPERRGCGSLTRTGPDEEPEC